MIDNRRCQTTFATQRPGYVLRTDQQLHHRRLGRCPFQIFAELRLDVPAVDDVIVDTSSADVVEVVLVRDVGSRRRSTAVDVVAEDFLQMTDVLDRGPQRIDLAQFPVSASLRHVIAKSVESGVYLAHTISFAFVASRSWPGWATCRRRPSVSSAFGSGSSAVGGWLMDNGGYLIHLDDQRSGQTKEISEIDVSAVTKIGHHRRCFDNCSKVLINQQQNESTKT